MDLSAKILIFTFHDVDLDFWYPYVPLCISHRRKCKLFVGPSFEHSNQEITRRRRTNQIQREKKVQYYVCCKKKKWSKNVGKRAHSKIQNYKKGKNCLQFCFYMVLICQQKLIAKLQSPVNLFECCEIILQWQLEQYNWDAKFHWNKLEKKSVQWWIQKKNL